MASNRLISGKGFKTIEVHSIPACLRRLGKDSNTLSTKELDRDLDDENESRLIYPKKMGMENTNYERDRKTTKSHRDDNRGRIPDK
jgi:hypothetical protein